MPLDGEDDDEDQTFLDKLTEDPIGRLRVLIRVVSIFFRSFYHHTLISI